MNITEKLHGLADEKYAAFQRKLVPGIDPESIIGVRVPVLRRLAGEISMNSDICTCFLNTLPHNYYDENMLHSILLCRIDDYDDCLRRVKQFLPYIDNWAVCDTLNPKVFAGKNDALITDVMVWIESGEPFTCRFGMLTLMNRFLDDGYKKEYLEYPAAVRSSEYYVNMMAAWFYATALAKHWDDAFVYIADGKLDAWVHNRTIQKAVESFRITEEKKELLKTFRHGRRCNGR